jgi:tetratricopeptide (TPR) repeat protein
MRVVCLAVVLFALAQANALSQTYPTRAPVPQTTALPALRGLAIDREIEERFRIGLDDEARRDWRKASGEFEWIVAHNPAEPRGSTARYDLAIAYANLQRYDDAERQLRAAIALDPAFLAAMANLISVELARGDLHAAREVGDRYVALDPQSARALYSRGIVALRDGDAATARADFGKLLQENPTYAVAHYDLALAEERLGRYDAAERELRTALTLSQTYARARFALGAVLLREGRRHEAHDAFARACLDAGADPALLNIATAMRDSTTI